MNGTAPSSLPSAALARRLAELCREERNVQADFLLHLLEYDRRRAYLEAGYGSLWVYCLEALHLRESAAGRRIAAMKVLRRFPALESPLRDGRLSLSTVNLLGPILTDENLDELVARAAFKSNAETEKLVASIQPRVAPADGIRRLPAARAPLGTLGGPDGAARVAPGTTVAMDVHPAMGASQAPSAPAPVVATTALVERPRISPARAELRPVSSDEYSLRITVDAAFKADLDLLVSLLSNTHRRDLAAALHEAVRCGIAKHGRRKGAVEPERPPKESAAVPASKQAPMSMPNPAPSRAEEGSPSVSAPAPAPAPGPGPGPGPAPAFVPAAPRRRPHIPIAVRRAVWKRDGGRCAWTAPDGTRCGSTYRLQLDHVEPAALGGPATIENIRLACEAHNLHRAVRTFGAAFMAPYLGGFAPAIGSDRK